MEEENIRIYIEKELSNFEFKKATKGFKYLQEAIYICILNENAMENLTKNVFPQVAKRYNEKSYLNVKWCINQVISTMYNNTNMKVICNYFGLDKNIKPSLKFIIYTIMCKYKRTLQKS